ncbi:hypothetical protein CSB45_02530 [candidate division KSB3 bacterium]|uniref:O-antigen ligase-related domain-containing protein n=1 Tax=candidate division KSB3 bacterium TaxID=2044937 RepID=A0A2G6E9Z5_9BACT|nr:MAG: hypothetical protein CSB45_02530 [candidate division KSB3 bacterium]PIE30956.1 MAG: hypothetical protein CSA57_01145 [candidate division KSB3 bacterium]
MTSLWIKNKVSRQQLEFLLTVLAALFVVRLYNRSPLLISTGLLLSACALPFFVKKPEFVIVVIAAALPFRDVHIVSLLYMKRAMIWAAFAYILLQGLGKRFQYGITRNLSLFTKFTAFFFASLAASLVKTAAALGTTSLVTPTMLKATVLFFALRIIEEILLSYISYFSLNTTHHIRVLLNVMLMVSAVVALLGILQYYQGEAPPLLSFLFDPELRFYGRATSIFSNPNELGGFIVIMLSIALVSFMWRARNLWQRYFLYLPLIVLHVWVLILSFSRGAAVQLFLSVIVIAYLYYTKLSHKKWTWKSFLPLLLITAILVLAVNSYDLYMRTRLSSYQGNSLYQALYHTRAVSDSLRKNAALQAIQTFVEHPLSGIGYDLFWGTRTVGFFSLSPHNQFLKILAEMGLLGFIPFLGMLIVTMRSGLSVLKQPAELRPGKDEQIVMLTLLSGMCSAVSGYLFVDSLAVIEIAGGLWILAGAIFALERNIGHSQTSSDAESMLLPAMVRPGIGK